jgi:hypothetical protein
MSRVFVHGLGAVSPAGWGVPALCEALERKNPLPISPLTRPGWNKPLNVRSVPAPQTRPAFLAHPRLRRAGAFTQQVVAAALEALGPDAERAQQGGWRLGVIVSTTAGCVNYSRRFYEEAINDPRTASPLLFPETVFNAPASHLAAFLNLTGINYTLVGDDGTFLQGLALAAQWLAHGTADACVVVGAEELDWVVADALRFFSRRSVYAPGAGALYLRCEGSPGPLAELAVVTDTFLFTKSQSREAATEKMKAQLASLATDAEFSDVPGVLGQGFNAAAAWRCVTACAALHAGRYPAASIGVVGANQQAIGVRFVSAGQTIKP